MYSSPSFCVLNQTLSCLLLWHPIDIGPDRAKTIAIAIGIGNTELVWDYWSDIFFLFQELQPFFIGALSGKCMLCEARIDCCIK